MNMNSPLAAQLLVCLVTAHVLGDFLLQTGRDIETKQTWKTLLKHSLLHALLAYALAGVWTLWIPPLAVFVSHAVIDRLKSSIKNPGWRAFLVDQAMHLVTLTLIAAWSTRNSFTPYWADFAGEWYLKGLILIAGATLTIYAGGYLIGLAVQPFLKEMKDLKDESDEIVRTERRGFTDGGQTIGRLERAMILLFVLTGNPAGIGLLFAAKSILRFGEVKDPAHRMEAEYTIIGSLMSFGYGILLAYVTRALLAVS